MLAESGMVGRGGMARSFACCVAGGWRMAMWEEGGDWPGGGAYFGVLVVKKERMDGWMGFVVGRDMVGLAW
jgi:hypothetical protein